MHLLIIVLKYWTEYAQKYPQKTRLIVNEKNSGKVFAQWNKGLSLAKGEYIWIAESDDYCDKGFLKRSTFRVAPPIGNAFLCKECIHERW